MYSYMKGKGKNVKRVLDNVSDDIYLNDEISLNENYFLNEAKVRESDYDFSTVFYNEITYNNSYVKIVDNNNVTTINYFNTDYELINSLRLEGSEYYTGNKIYGYDMLDLDYNMNGTKKTNFKINGDGYLRLNNNVLTSTDFRVTVFNERINDFYASKSAFYRAELMVRISNIANKEVKAKLILNTQSNAITTTGSFSSAEVPLQKTKNDVWQRISIPVYFHDPEMTVTSCQVEFVGASNETIDVAYFYIYPSSVSFYRMDDDRIFHNITEIGYKTSSNSSVTYYPVNKDYYMSKNDIYLTLLNKYKVSLNNTSKFDLILCDNRKRIEVTDFYLNFLGEKYNIYLGVLHEPNLRFMSSSMDDDDKYLHKREFIYFEEDDNGNVLINYKSAQCCREDKNPYVASNAPSTVSTYNECGMEVKETDACRNTQTYVYDSYGNIDEEIVKSIDGDEITTMYLYNHVDESLKECLAYVGNNTDYKMLYVDLDEEVVWKEELNDKIKEYEYDKFYDLTKKIKFTRYSDERLLNTHSFKYDNHKNISEMRSSAGLNHSFEYNDLNLLSKVKDNLYLRENYTYSLNQIVNESSVDIRNAQIVTKTTQTKNLNNQLVTNVNKKYYDKFGNLRIDKYNNQSCVYKYNDYNELEEVNDCFTNYTHKFERDPIYGLLTHSVYKNNVDLIYEKEYITNHRIKYKFADGIIRNTYNTYADGDEQYRLIKTGDRDSDFQESETDYIYDLTYNNAGLINKVSSKVKNGNIDFTKEITYNNTKDKIVKIIHNADDSKMTDTYEYDGYGRLSYIDEYSPVESNCIEYQLRKQVSYEYDEFNRLVEENNSHFEHYIYEYDNDGNIIKIISSPNLTLKTFHYVNRKLINVSGIGEISYDSYGNIIRLGTTKLQYGSNNKLSSITKTIDGVSVTENYYYDFQGIRYKKDTIKNGTTEITEYVYDGNRLLKEITKNSNGNVIREFKYYYNMQGICGIRYNGVNYTYVKDVLGNIRKILKGGNVICDYTYDAWGNQVVDYLGTLSSSDEYIVASKNPFRYRGYYYDVETQLFYCNSRYYSPELCRFISPDSIEYLDPQSINGLNLYCYCMNNPVMCS